MSSTIHRSGAVIPARAAPSRDATLWSRGFKSLFPSPAQGLITVVLIALLLYFVPAIIEWALIDAVWSPAEPGECSAPGAGACWAVVAEKHRVMLFGAFPYSEHWRAFISILLLLVGFGYSAFPGNWRPRLFAVWSVVLALVMWLMLGGFGLSQLSTSDWGGLPLTFILFAGTVTFGMPLSLTLALGRESRMPAFRWVCIGTIELFRGLPLLVVLFLASLLIPLFLGEGVTIDKFVRALIGMVLFFGAYASEIIRGGLQALPKGQYEGARALGLTYWPMMITIILPQALRIVVPALVNDIIRAFKNTSFVAVIGLFDFLGATKAALEDPVWVRYSLEAYLFLIFVYFAFCWTMSRYALWVEKRIDVERRSGA